ncbi:MAG: hypothetical protein WAX38_05155 [Minisyncoccia bacterium]
MDTTQKSIAPLLISVVVALAVLAGAGYYYVNMTTPEPVAESAPVTLPVEVPVVPEETSDANVDAFLAQGPSTSDDVVAIESDISGSEFDSMMASIDADLADL